MGIRLGEPQPITAMKVGVGRERREEGLMERVRVRRYSWQFCDGERVLVHLVGWRWEKGEREEGKWKEKTNSAEEMPDEDY